MNKILNKKSISPLIAAILIIVVAVALVSIILNWGKSFTTSSLDNVSSVSELKANDATHFIFNSQLKGDLLTFTYSPSTNLKNKQIDINGYTVVGSNDITYLSSPVTLSEGVVGIPGMNLSSYSVSGSLVDLALITTTQEVINLSKVKYLEIAEPPAPLPYIIASDGTRLYIYPFNPAVNFNWSTANNFCANLDYLDYDDWYLPSTNELSDIWFSCPDQYPSNNCLNANINKDLYSGDWDDFINNWYWSSNEVDASFAYYYSMDTGSVSSGGFKNNLVRYRCVRK